MGKDYYKILGVSKDANEDEIKRAYKKQALKWHPDRNAGNTEAASQKFKEISEAFEVLSDKQKRTIFDQLGEEGLKGGGAPPSGSSGGSFGGGFPGFGGSGGSGGFPGGTTFTFTSGGPGGRTSFSPSDPNDIFASFFKNMGGMGGSMFTDDDDMAGFNRGGSFSMFGNGGMPRMSRQSSGRRSSFPPGGPGTGARSSSPSPEITRPLKVTLEELYSGATKRLKVGRRLLSGQMEDKILEITVLPGWKSGTKVRFPRAGNETASGDAQDLVFVVEEKPHSRFVREGSDLITTMKIPLVDALTSDGGTRQIESLAGTKINIPIPSGVIRPGQETRVRGEGMPIRKDGAQRSKGDLVVKWDVVFPDRLTPSQKEGVRKVLR